MRRRVVVGAVVVMAALAAVTWSTVHFAPGTSPTADAHVEQHSAPVPTAVRPRAKTEGATGETPATARVVRGKVTTSDEAPIADADVGLFAVNKDGLRTADRQVVDFAHPLATARSAANGAFEVSATADAALVVLVRKDGFVSKAASAGDEAVHVVLVPGAEHAFEVVDDDGRAVAGAEIRVFDDVIHPEAATDAKGRARLVVADGTDVIVASRGFATERWMLHLGESPEDPEHPVQFVLHEGRSLAGVVVDGAGKPLGGALVTLGCRGEDTNARTTADGCFSFDGLPSGDCRVDGKLDGWVCDPVKATPGDVDVRVVMRRPATARGVVVYEDGSPAVGAHVGWQESSDNVTDENGRFEIADEAPGTWIVRAWAPAPGDARVTFSGSTTVTAPEGASIENVRIAIGPSKTTSYVLVHVVDADGRPASGANVHVFTGRFDATIAPNTTEDNGEVVLQVVDVPIGRLVVLAASLERDGGVLAARADSIATQGAPPLTPVELRLGLSARLRLRFVDTDGHEIAPARVKLAMPTADGTYRLDACQQFHDYVEVAGFARRVINLDPPHAALRDETVRLLPACRVRGRVLDVPEDEHLVDLWLDTVEGHEFRYAELDRGGQFEFTAIPPGRARLDAFNHALVRTFDIAPGATVDLGDLTPEKPTPFRVAVVDGAGNGLGGAQVEFYDAPLRELFGSAIATRPDGTLDVKLPHRGDLHLVVGRRGFATRIVAVPDGAPQPFRVALGPAGRVRIVTSARGRDPGGDHVDARLPGNEWTWRPREAVSDDPFAPVEDALHVFDDLPPGPVELSLVSRLRTRTKTVDVVAGKTVDCVLGE